MTKQRFTLVLLLITSFLCHSQERICIKKNFNQFNIKIVEHNNQSFYKIDMGEGFSDAVNLGKANLPLMNTWVTSPICENIRIENLVLSKDTINLQGNIQIEPKQKSIIKDLKNRDFLFDKEYYSSNEFMGENPISIHQMGVMGGENLVLISISPLRYCPKSNTIERIKKISFDLVFVNEDMEKTQLLKSKSSPLMNRFIHNKSIGASVNNIRNYPYKMVIVADDMFERTLEDFIAWKKMQGFKITTLYTSQIGSTAQSIKDYLTNLYNSSTIANPAFDYLLIVGDIDKIPAFTGSHNLEGYSAHQTDFNYAEYTGDMLPDVFYGRMSAEDTSTLRHILDKTIAYEKCIFQNDSFLNNTLLVAGKETSNDAPTYTNGQMNYLKNYFVNYTDTIIYTNPSSGTTTNRTNVINDLNDGNGWVIYSAHGQSDGWYSPSLRNNDVENLTNFGKYGIFINNCCLAGKFDDDICFNEAIVQAENKGAVASIAASDYTMWDEDYKWSVGSKDVSLYPIYESEHLGTYDRLFHSHGEMIDDQYITMGQMIAAGNMAVSQSLSPYSKYYWEAYHLEGDPSLMPYIGSGESFDVDIIDTLSLGNVAINLTLPPYTYVAISSNDSLLYAGFSDESGDFSAVLNDLILEQGRYNIVLSHQFYKPQIDSFFVKCPSTEFIAIKNVKIYDALTGETPEYLQEGRGYTVDLTIKNTGCENIATLGNNIALSCANNLTLYSNNIVFNSIDAGNSINVPSAFSFKVNEGAKNISQTFIIFSRSDVNQTIYKYICAPNPKIASIALKLSGDTVKVGVKIKNYGLMSTSLGSISINGFATSISAEDTLFAVETIEKDSSVYKYFTLTGINENIDSLTFSLHYSAGLYSDSQTFCVALQEKIETFENGFFVFDWHNSSDNAWVIDDSIYYLGTHSARSGRNISDNESSTLSFDIEAVSNITLSFFVKVSCEKNYDAFHFYIDGEEKLMLSDEVAWTKKSFQIGAGHHNIKFVYNKDYSYSYGEDCAWIDNVSIKTGSDDYIFSLKDIANNDIVLFPNPAKNMIHINGLTEQAYLLVYDNGGKLRLKEYLVAGDNLINISNLNVGAYYLKIADNKGNISTKKLIITK